MNRKHEKYDRLLAGVKTLPPVPTAIAHPCDEWSLAGATDAARIGLIVPILVGPAARIKAVADRCGRDSAAFEIVDTPHSHASAAAAVQLVREGRAECLMKGSPHTDELMSAVVARDGGLRTARRISHCFVMDVPTYPEMLIVSDAAVNIAPTLEEKVDIVQNAIDLAPALGMQEVRVAILSAMETVNPRVPSTIEAAALCKMAERSQITGGILDGPLALDNAINPQAAQIKPRRVSCGRRSQATVWSASAIASSTAGSTTARRCAWIRVCCRRSRSSFRSPRCISRTTSPRSACCWSVHRRCRKACFDTAFHRSNPELGQRFALPAALHAQGIRRYGFHRLSYECVASVLPQHDARMASGHTVVLHLGNGASMCAMQAGRSVASTMGFTALDGLPMGTRCGALDPGVILFLMDQHGMDARALEQLLYGESGLLGVSEISSDMRALLASTDPRARLAVDLYVYRIGRELGSLAAALGGLDAIVFTAGIGANAVAIRERVCRDAAWLGVELDPAANAAGGPRLSAAGSSVSARAIPTNEELMIARHTRRVIETS